MRTFLLILAILAFASPIFAQEPAGGTAAVTNWPAVAGVLAMAIASGLCGLAQGRAVGQAAEGLARNPGAAPSIRFALLLGLVLIESLALYTLVIVLLRTTA